jgi:hypothetical protein
MRKPPRPGSRSPGKDCPVCRQIRRFLMGAGFLLVMMWAQPQWILPKGLDYATLVGDVFLAVFVLVFGWKYYHYRQEKKASSAADEPRDQAPR